VEALRVFDADEIAARGTEDGALGLTLEQ
jgi:hypothetical protein